MSYVKAKPGESFEALMRRFKKAVERSGLLADLKKNEFYEKPSVKRKRKQAAARKRAAKQQQKLARYADKKGSNKSFKWNKDRTKKIPMPPPKKFVPKKDFKRSDTNKSGFTNQSRTYNKNQSRPYKNKSHKGTKS